MTTEDIQFWTAAALLALGVLAILLWPLFKRRADAHAPREEYDINVYKDQLREIEADLERGLLSEDQGEAARTEIKRRMLAAAASAEAGTARADAHYSSKPIIAIMALAVPLGAVLLYLSLGNPGLPDQPLAARNVESLVAQNEQERKITESTVKLAEYLQSNPDDLRGWRLLARTYVSLGRYQESVSAYTQAYRLSDENPELGVNYAEALTLAAQSQISEQARQLFSNALDADITDPKSRYYLGMYEAQQGNVRAAMQAWIDLVRMSPPDAPWLPILNQQIDRAADESGIDPATLKPSAEAKALGDKVLEAAARARAEQAAAPGPTNEDVKAALGMEEGDRNQMIRSMVERLAAKMQDDPGNKEGWVRLERAYRVLGEIEKADHAAAQAAKLP